MPTSPYVPVVIAALFPVVLAAVAKAGGAIDGVRFDNRRPREILASLSGWPRRADAAQQNSWEAFAVFGIGVALALHAGVDASRVAFWGWIFIALRAAFVACYLANLPTPRSLFWVGGFGLSLWLMLGLS
ncbi:MAG: MAPEG family protein [Candidatus Dactylopiibacterium sp.]|nr:MAPEG family protein [Candidatus Dactylopiibacterium sp.]